MNRNDIRNNKWISFSYVGKEIAIINIVKKHQHQHISYKTNKNSGKLLNYRQQQFNEKCSEKSYTHFNARTMESST